MIERGIEDFQNPFSSPQEPGESKFQWAAMKTNRIPDQVSFCFGTRNCRAECCAHLWQLLTCEWPPLLQYAQAPGTYLVYKSHFLNAFWILTLDYPILTFLNNS